LRIGKGNVLFCEGPERRIDGPEGVEGALEDGRVFHGWAFGSAKETAIEIIKEAGWEIFEFPESDYEKWAAMSQPIHEKYINSLEAKGLPAREIYNDILRMIKEAKQ